MKKIVLFLFFSFSLSVFGQEEYYERIIGEDADFALFYAITATPDGGFALLGEQNNSTNLLDTYLVKTDADGNEEWSQTYGSNNIQDKGLAAFTTEDNQILIVGHSEGVDLGETGELFFKKIDWENGNEIWSKTTTMSAPYFEINLNNEGDAIWVTERILTPNETGNAVSYLLHQFDFEGEKIDEIDVLSANASIIEDSNDYIVTFGLISINDDPLQPAIYTYILDTPNAQALEMPWLENLEEVEILDFTFDSEDNLIVLLKQNGISPVYIASYTNDAFNNYSYDWHITSPESLDYRTLPNKNYLKYDENSQKLVPILQYRTSDFEDQTACLQVQSDGTFLSYETFDTDDFSDLHIDNDKVFIVGNNTQIGATEKGILLQIAENGTELFQKEYGIDGTESFNYGRGMQYIGNDEFLVLNSIGSGETQILKMSNEGDILETYPFESIDSHRGMVPSNDGQYLTTNYDNNEDYLKLVKFTAEGEKIWEAPIPYQIGYTSLDPYQYLVSEPDGYTHTIFSNNGGLDHAVSFIKIGENGSVIDSVGTLVETDLFLLRSTYKMSNGHYIVSSNYGHTEFDEEKNLIQNVSYETGEAAYYSKQIMESPTGQINSIGRKYIGSGSSPTGNAISSWYVLQFDENGNITNEITDTIQGRAFVGKAIPAHDGTGIMMVGNTDNYDISTRESFLAKMSWEGEIEWTLLFDHETALSNFLVDIIQVDEHIAMTGRIDINNTRKLYYVNTDESLYNPDTVDVMGLNDLSFQNANIQLFPNPTPDKISIVFENNQVFNGNITITNTMGQIIKTIQAPIFPNATLEIPVRNLTDGIYIVNIQNGKEVIAKQFMVQH